MTADQYARLKAQDPRFRGLWNEHINQSVLRGPRSYLTFYYFFEGSSTLPRVQAKEKTTESGGSGSNTLPNREKITNTALGYESGGERKQTGSIKQMKDRETATPGGKISSHITINAQTSHATTGTSTATISGTASQTDDVRLFVLL